MDDNSYPAYLKGQSYETLQSIRSSLDRSSHPDRYAMVLAEIEARDKRPVPPPLPKGVGFTGAGFWIRALARIIDMAVGVVLGFAAGLLGMVILAVMEIAGATTSGWQYRIQGMSLAGIGFSLLGGLLYHSFAEGIHGSSLGKAICQLRVLQGDGGPSTMNGAIKRSLGWLIDGLFFGAVGWNSMSESPLRQRYGDVWGRTIVVKTEDIPARSRRSTLRFLGGLFVGATCWLSLLVLGLVLKAR